MDCEDRIIAVKPSQPSGNWAEIYKEVEVALGVFGETLDKVKYANHDRGNFSCFSMGLSYGGGQKVLNFAYLYIKLTYRFQQPQFLRSGVENKENLDRFIESPAVKKYTAHVAGEFACLMQDDALLMHRVRVLPHLVSKARLGIYLGAAASPRINEHPLSLLQRTSIRRRFP